MGQQRVMGLVMCTAAVLLASPPAPAMGTSVTNTRAAGPSTPPQRQAAAPSGNLATPSSAPFDHEALWLAVAAMALAARNIAVRMR